MCVSVHECVSVMCVHMHIYVWWCFFVCLGTVGGGGEEQGGQVGREGNKWV